MNTDHAHRNRKSDSTIVVYDGACGICQAFASWLMRLDQGRCLSLEAYQQVDPAKLPVALTPTMMQQAMHLIDSQGCQFSGARAVFQALRHLPGIWGSVGAVFSNPLLSWIAEPFYRMVANHRETVSRMLRMRVCESVPSNQQQSPP